MEAIFWKIVALAVIGYLLACLALYLKQRSFLYYPTERVDHPLRVEIFENQGERVEVIVINEGKENAALYFGGNAEIVAYHGVELRDKLPDVSVYLVNYRGYGGSSGSPSESALLDDALFIYDRIIEWHNSVDIVGRSLGSGVAIHVASLRPVEKMVLITPYDSIRAIGQSLYPIFPIGLILKDHFDSASRVDKVDARTLVVLAEDDRVIPLKSSERLIAKFSDDLVRTVTIKGASHNDVTDTDLYYELLNKFLAGKL